MILILVYLAAIVATALITFELTCKFIDKDQMVGSMKISETEEKYLYSMELTVPIEDIPKKKRITFNVVNEHSQDLQGV